MLGLNRAATMNPKRRSWRRWMVYSFIAIVFGVVCLVTWFYFAGHSALRQAIAETDRLDPHWRILDIEANRETIPDAENAALLIQNAKKLTGKTQYGEQEEKYDNWLTQLKHNPAHRANDNQKAALRAMLQPYEHSVVEYRKLASMPKGRYPIKYTPDLIGTLLGVQDSRDAIRALDLECLDRIENGNAESAAATLHAMFNAGAAVGDEPTLISMLVRIACHTIAINAVERFLAQTEANDETLAKLQSRIEELAAVPLLYNGLRGERGFSYGTMEFLKSSPKSFSSMSALVGSVPQNQAANFFNTLLFFFPGAVDAQQAITLRFMNKVVEAARRPMEEHPTAFAEFDKQAKDLPMLTKLLMPAMSKVAEASYRSQAQFRCAIVAIAAERYRRTHQKWPEQQQDLVAANLLSKVLLDPYDGNPIRWKGIPEGRLVYSIGKDRVDNGGRIEPEKPAHDGYDAGLRVYDPDKRRQSPLPIKTNQQP